MFTLTDEEKATAEQIEGLQQTIKAKQQELRQLSGNRWNQTAEEKEAQEQAAEALKGEIASLEQQTRALMDSEQAMLFAAKGAINEKIEEWMPIPAPVWLTLAEELVGKLDEESGQRTTVLAKGLILRIIHSIGDDDLQKARAEVTAGRYKALIAAGLDEDLAARVIVAEASRPLIPNLSYGSK